MTTEKKRKKLVEYINDCDDKMAKAIFEILKTNADFPLLSKKEIKLYNKEIDKAMKEIDKGNFVTHEEVKAQLKKKVKSRDLQK